MLLLGDHSRMSFNQRFDLVTFRQGRRKIVVVYVSFDENGIRKKAMCRQQSLFLGNFSFGNTSEKVGTNILRLRRWSIIGVAANIEIVIVRSQNLCRDDSRVAR